MTLEQLRARLKEITGANDAIEKTLKDENRLMTADELKAFQARNDEADAVVEQIKALERAKAVRAASAVPANEPAADPTVPAAPAVKLSAMERVGIIIGGLAKAKHEPHKSPLQHIESMGFASEAKELDTYAARMKTLNTQAAVQGGILVPETVSSEIIELLRPSTSFLRGNPRRIPLPNGNMQMPAAASGATASYTTEAEPAAVTEPGFREVNMSVKTLAAVVPMTNDLLSFSLPAARSFVQEDLQAAMSEKMDTAAYRGDGLQGNPLGIFNVSGINSYVATNSTTPTIAQIDADARKAMNGILLSNLSTANCKWVMNPLTLGYLMDLRDGNGNLAYPTLQGPNPTFKGYPVLDTTNLPVNLGGGSNEGFIAFIKWDQVLFGEANGLTLAVSNEAMLEIGSARISLFQRRMTAVLAVMQHDFGLRHLRAVSLLTAVKWGN